MPAYGRKKLATLPTMDGQGQGCQERLPGKAAGQGCIYGAIAESMVKLVKNAVFEQSLHKKNNTNNNNKARLRPALYVPTRVKIIPCYFSISQHR
jgi:hypothetical protein